jgi:hypothetical protein
VVIGGEKVHIQYVHRPTYILNVSIPASTLLAGLRTSLYNMYAHVLNNVHTWASVFLRHLASTSFMVPFWAYTVLTPALSPFRGARVRSRACPEEVVYSLNDSCSDFTQRLFPPNVPHQHIMYIHILILHNTLMYTSHLHFFCSSWQAGCSRLFVSDTVTGSKSARD